jgi:hypothetical protein
MESERLVAEAEHRRASLEQRIEELQAGERAFLNRLKSFLDEHRRTLEAHPLLAESETGKRKKEGARER